MKTVGAWPANYIRVCRDCQLWVHIGNSIIYVTHDQVEATTMADKIAVLRDGPVEQFGALLDLYNRPDNVFVVGFIGSPKMNFLEGQVVGGKLNLDGGEVIDLLSSGFAMRENARVILGIRPNAIQQSTDCSRIRMNVRSVERLGGESYFYGTRISGGVLTVHRLGQTDVTFDTELTLEFDIEQEHLFDAETSRTLRLEEDTAA